MKFSDQLQATRANLERLEKLAQEAPDLIEHGHLICVAPDGVQVYVHATSHQEIDWPAMAAKYRAANWQREQSPAYHRHYDWKGIMDGIEVSILGAEKKPEPQPLFAEGVAA